MTVSPYLFFNGRCEEAVDFYKEALGAEVEMMMRFSEAPDGPPPQLPPGNARKIMHAAFKIAGASVMASDGMCQGGSEPAFNGFGISLTLPDSGAAERAFAALSDGGTVMQPLMKTFFAPSFGMVADRFGVTWLVLAAA